MARRTLKKDKVKKLPFTRKNYIFFGIGLAVLAIGFLALSVGPWDSFFSLTLAPLLLLAAYLVIFPLAILYHKKSADRGTNET